MPYYGIVVSLEDLFWHFAKDRYPEVSKCEAIKRYIYDQRDKIKDVEFDEERKRDLNNDPVYYGKRCIFYYGSGFFDIEKRLYISNTDGIGIYIGSGHGKHYNQRENYEYIADEKSAFAALEDARLDGFLLQEIPRLYDIELPRKEKLC